MVDDALGQLLEQRVQRDRTSVVTPEVVSAWTAEFGAHWAECEGDVVPSVMYTTFARPPAPPAAGEVAPTGLALHDQLKAVLDLPVAIAVGYELELSGVVHIDDQLISAERIADLGEERSTTIDPARSNGHLVWNRGRSHHEGVGECRWSRGQSSNHHLWRLT
jgi:hypothetical protein